MCISIRREMTLEKKLYQLIISRLDGERINESAYRKKIFNLTKKGIGGFILFGGKKAPIRSFIHKMQSVSKIPLFIASDIERGVGQQIKGATVFPPQMAVASAIDKTKKGDVILLKQMLNAIGDEVSDIGINMALIPVLDVNQNPLNPIISTRAFSDNPEVVSWFGKAYIKAFEGRGILCSAKHFPGHGDTEKDSHIKLPVIKKSYRDLMKTDIAPFTEAIKSKVSSIMVGHLLVPMIDLRPATLSKKLITDILRKEVGFNGLILTDALNMGALKNIKDVPLKCIKAGVDILLHPVDVEQTVRELLSAIKSKRIDEKRISESINRILNIKSRLNPPSKVGLEGLSDIINYRGHKLLSTLITGMSITLMKGKNGVIPIKKNKTHLILAGQRKLFMHCILKKYFKNTSEIKKTKTLKADISVFALFTSPSAWKGTLDIGYEEKNKIVKLIKNAKSSIVISFGSPYVLRHFKSADTLIAVCDVTEPAQRAVIKCLRGEMYFKGRMTVKIDMCT